MGRSFEDKIKAATNSASASVAAHNWDKIQNKLDHPFESSLQSKLEPYTQAPNPAIWASIATVLPNSIEAGIQNKVSGFEQVPPLGLWEGIANSMEEIPGDFEAALQDKFDGFTAPPPTGSLEAIEAQMDGQRTGGNWKKRIAPILAMAAVALLFVTLPNRVHNQGEENNYQAGIGNTNDDWTVASSTGPDESTALASPSLDAAASRQNGMLGGVNDKNLASLSETEQNVSTGSYASGTHSRSNGNSNISSASQSGGQGLRSTGVLASQNHSRGFKDLAFMQALGIKQLEGFSTEFPFQVSTSEVTAEIASIESPKETKVNTVSVTAGSGMFNIRNRSRYASKNFDNGYVDFHNTLYTGGNYVSIGSDIQIALSNNRSVVTGLSVTSAKQYMAFSTHRKETPTYSLLRDDNEVVTGNYNPTSDLLNKKETSNESVLSVVDQAEIAGDSVISGSTYSMTNSFVFVDIPLGMNFKVADRKKHSFNVRGGAKLRLVAGANTFHLTQDRDRMIEVSSAISQTFYQSSMAGFVAVDYSHDMGENLEWYIGPELAMNFSDINKEGTWISMRPLQAGISIGLRQQLN